MTYHFVGTADEDSDGARVGAVLDYEHLVACGTERDLAHDSSLAELLRREILKPGDDPTVRGDGDELRGVSSSQWRCSKGTGRRHTPQSQVHRPIVRQGDRSA